MLVGLVLLLFIYKTVILSVGGSTVFAFELSILKAQVEKPQELKKKKTFEADGDLV